MAVDASMRKLEISPKFMSYLEKHRIYELLYDLGHKFALEQPADPLRFLQESLELMQPYRDQRLVLLIVPPNLNKAKLVQRLSQKTGFSILSRYLMESSKNFYDASALAEFTAKYIRSSKRVGWILSDYPDSVEEVNALIKIGMVPTHAFLLLQDDNDQSDIKEHKSMQHIDTSPSLLLNFGNSIYSLRNLLKSSLKVVKIKDRSVDELGDLCARLAIKRPPCSFPKIFRVALLGPRASGRRTLAKLLQKRFKLTHVDMDDVINALKIKENEVGDEIRFMDRNNYTYSRKLVYQSLKDRLEQRDCKVYGYVLTNFPTCLDDFVFLDSLDTPPNRVIFLDIDPHECLAKIEDRVVNVYSGALHSKKEIEGDILLKRQTLRHPDDEIYKVTQEIQFYLSRVESMQEYCGGTSFMVDGRGSTKSVFERLEAVLMGSLPAANARSGTFSRTKTVEIERPEVKPRMSYPTSYTYVAPHMDEEELIRRFKKLKHIKSSISEGEI